MDKLPTQDEGFKPARKKRKRLPADVRRRLRLLCQEAYVKKTGETPFGPGRTTRFMTCVLAGRNLTRGMMWEWLNREFATTPAPKTEQVPFYQGDEWRALRYTVLRKSDGRCSLCGRSKREHGVQLHVDHIKPRSKFPELELDARNLQVLCEDCNLGKGNRDAIDWRAAS